MTPEEYVVFCRCDDCLKIVGKLADEKDWFWTEYAERHRKEGKCKGTHFSNVLMPADWFDTGCHLDEHDTPRTQPPAQSPTQRLPPFEELEESLR